MYKVERRKKVEPAKNQYDNIMVMYILDQYNIPSIVPKTKAYIWVDNEAYVSFRFIAPDEYEYEEMIKLEDLNAFAYHFHTQITRESKIEELGL
jgi:hypothetical protein